jgi:hypothetical protein
MKLIGEIIEGATDSKTSIADTLRKCLVLSFKLKNDNLKEWLNKELNGYICKDELPEYRKSIGIAKGLFLGGFGAQIDNQPLSPSVLKEQHRHLARNIDFFQPIASYENADGITNAISDWPADITAMYQLKFIDGYVLNRAWIEIPASITKGLLDTVRTRLLYFALEIQAQLPSGDEAAVEEIPLATVEQIIQVTIINGGYNVIGNVDKFQSITINKGDIEALRRELQKLGIEQSDIEQFEKTLSSEGVEEPKTLGNKTLGWITATARRLGASGLRIGEKVVEETIKSAVKGYLGL